MVLDEGTLYLKGAANLDMDHFTQKYLPCLEETLEDFGLGKLTCQLQVEEALSEVERTFFEEERAQALLAAQESLASLEESLPKKAPAPAPVPDYSQRSTSTSALDKSKITPMIDVQGEERGLTFEGYVFALEHTN